MKSLPNVLVALAAGCALMGVAGCVTARSSAPREEYFASTRPTMSLPTTRTFGPNEIAETMAMIEFCIEMNNQDDRLVSGARKIYNVIPARSTDLWTKVGDSRELYAQKHLQPGSPDVSDPSKNGFPPFDSAWTLWKKKQVPAGGAPVYTLAFRGTVFSNKFSDYEDVLGAMVAARHGIYFPGSQGKQFLPLTFDTIPRAEVHEGFAYAVFSQLFDAEFGALPVIMRVIEPGSTLIFTGHSQGASVGTLAHAFFHYAGQENLCGIGDKKLTLRSHLFAQPKPGNSQFAQDFAEITGAGTTATIYTNTLDAVPKLPPSHIFLADATEDMPAQQRPIKFLKAINNGWNGLRRVFSLWTENKLARQIAVMKRKEHDGIYRWKELIAASVAEPPAANSQGYMPAGNMVPLRGHLNALYYYDNAHDETDDEVIQHHATTYRRLLEDLYGYPATTEQNAPR